MFLREMPKLKKQRQHLRGLREKTSSNSSKSTVSAPPPPSVPPPPPSVPETEEQEQSSTTGITQEHPAESLSTSDSDFDPEEALNNDPTAMLEDFVMDWAASLPRDDVYSLALLLFHILQQDFQQLNSKLIAKWLAKNYKTIQKWRLDFITS